jgi:hypothetical protein
LASNGEIGDPCGVPFSRATRVPSAICMGAVSHRWNEVHVAAAAHYLVHAGLITTAALGLVGRHVAAVLTPAGHQALDAYALAA